MSKPKLLMFVLSWLSISICSAQSIPITGTVLDEEGITLPGVNIVEKGTTNGTITDLDGNFSLKVSSENSVLQFSFIGFEMKEQTVGKKRDFSVSLKSSVQELDELVVVGYGTQKRISVTGAVSVLKEEDLQIAPSATVATALTGKLPGLIVVQNSGVAGAKSSDIQIRGIGTLNTAYSGPLVLVDGVERGFEDIDADEIQSVSILKDASATAVYGVKGANGVIIVTTKRGRVGKAKINLKTNFGLVLPGDLPDMLDSYEYAMLKNEGTINDADGGTYTLPYTEEDLALFQSGEDPIFHPDNNWYEQMTNDYGYKQRYTISIDGGSDKMQYFTSLGYYFERDIYTDYDVGYDDRSYFRRYNIRSNLDFKLSETSKFSFDIGGQFSDRNKPNVGFNDLLYNMFRTPPASFAGIIDGRIIQLDRTIDYQTPLEALYDNGYQRNYSNSVQASAKFQQNLDFITEGLSFKTRISYDHGFSSNQTSSKNIPVYFVVEDPQTGEISYIRDGIESRLGNSRRTGTNARKINFRATLNYSREFAGGHSLSGLGVFTTNNASYHSSEFSYVPIKYVEMATRVSYNYNLRYFIEFNGGYNGSENFHEDFRFGFFPSVSGGWVVSNESFFPKNNVLNFLKVRASYGVTGNDRGPAGRFYYNDTYTLSNSGGYRFGLTPAGQGNAVESELGNAELTWEKSYQQNYAIETKWFNDKLKLDGDFFFARREDILIERNSVPSVVAANLPQGNLAIVENKGFEIQARWKDKIGKIDYSIHGNYNFHENKIVFMDEVPVPYPWLEKTGGPVRQLQGLVWEGYYTQEEVDEINAGNASPSNPASGYTGKLQAGDMRFKDLNEDGIIDDNDMMWHENTSLPKTTFGFGADISYKNFSASVFFQGVTDYTYNISSRVRTPYFNNIGNGLSYVLGRWTPETADQATFPRISANSSNADHNYQNSDFWFRDASYIRLKNAEVAYKIKSKGLRKAGIKNMRVFLNGTNLFTWSKFDLVDPESKTGDKAPIPPSKVINLGVSATF